MRCVKTEAHIRKGQVGRDKHTWYGVVGALRYYRLIDKHDGYPNTLDTLNFF